MTKARATPFGVFAACNGALFGALAAAHFANHAFGFYHGPADLDEFVLYSMLIFALSVAGWKVFRRTQPPRWVLVMMELGILGHLAGGFVPFHGARLYDADILGVGYDHYLHAFNGLAGAMLANSVLPQLRGAPSRGVVVVLVVLGVGSLVEIIEYGAYVAIHAKGVGGYDNNMRDMTANMIGAFAFLGIQALPLRQGALALRREKIS